MDEITLCEADGRRPLPQQSCPEKAEQTNHLAWKGSAHVEKPTASVNQQGISAITADTSLRTVHHRRQIYPTFSLGYPGIDVPGTDSSVPGRTLGNLWTQ